jgi:hypothetical protein
VQWARKGSKSNTIPFYSVPLYLEDEEVVGGGGGQRCGTSASAATAICAYTKCKFVSIIGLQDEMNIQMSKTTQTGLEMGFYFRTRLRLNVLKGWRAI